MAPRSCFSLASGSFHLPSKIRSPAIIARTAKAVVAVLETLMLSKGNKPERISHKPSKSIPMLLVLKLVRFIWVPPLIFMLTVLNQTGGPSLASNSSIFSRHSELLRLCSIRTQRFQRRIASSLFAGLIFSAASKYFIASSNIGRTV